MIRRGVMSFILVFLLIIVLITILTNKSTSVNTTALDFRSSSLRAEFDFVRKNIGDPSKAARIEHIWKALISQYIRFPLDQAYGSHTLVLLAAVLLTDGPILELGSGFFSTPMLHNITDITKRRLLTTDSNRDWLSKFTSIETPLHKLRLIVPGNRATDWDTVGSDECDWSVVFVDHAPAARRLHELVKFSFRAQLVVVHDTEAALYNYDTVASFYPYRYRYTYLATHTDVWSTRYDKLVNETRRLLELTVFWQLPKS